MQLNVPNSTLKAIEHNYMLAGGVGRCLSETLTSWYNNNRNASWNEICAALHTVNEVALAKKVAKNHGKLASCSALPYLLMCLSCSLWF